jgi:hypothetical protein
MILRIFIILLLLTTYSFAEDVTQTNVNGGNTSISGGMTTATTYENGSSSNSTTTSNSTSNIRSAPPSAYAPGFNSSGVDVCSVLELSAGVQTFGFGISGGGSFKDENCERIKLSRQLDSMGMKVAAVSLLCQDQRVFFAMEMAGTPCPYEGKIGKDAAKQWKKYGKLRPDYKLYTKKLKIIEEEEREKELKFAKEMIKATKK